MDHVPGVRELAAPQGPEARVLGQTERLDDAVARVIRHGDPPLWVVDRRIRHGAARRAGDLDDLGVAGVRHGDANEADRPERAGRAAHRRRVVVGAVVQEPHVASGDHRIPAVAVPRSAVIAQAPILVERELPPVPVRAPDRLGADDVHGVAVGRQPRHRRFGQRQRRAPRHERRRVEQDEFGGLALIEIEVLDRERPVAEDDERVVGTIPHQTPVRERREVGRQPMAVVAVHDVQRSVGVGGESAWPERAAAKIRRATLGCERQRVQALDPTRARVAQRLGADRVAQHEQLSRVAQDEHRGRVRVAVGGERQALVRPDLQRRSRRELVTARSTVLGRPSARPQSGVVHAPRGAQAMSRESASAAVGSTVPDAVMHSSSGRSAGSTASAASE